MVERAERERGHSLRGRVREVLPFGQTPELNLPQRLKSTRRPHSRAVEARGARTMPAPAQRNPAYVQESRVGLSLRSGQERRFAVKPHPISSIPISNAFETDLLVAIEPEGFTFVLPPGRRCVIVMHPELGCAEDLEFLIECKHGTVVVWLCCAFRVYIEGVEVPSLGTVLRGPHPMWRSRVTAK